MNTEAYTLYSRVFWIFLPNIIKINPYNFELYRFKESKLTHFLRHSVVCDELSILAICAVISECCVWSYVFSLFLPLTNKFILLLWKLVHIFFYFWTIVFCVEILLFFDVWCWQAIQSGIQQSKRSVTGFLFGATSNTQLYVHSYATIGSDCHDKLKDEVDRIKQCLPGGALILHLLCSDGCFH